MSRQRQDPVDAAFARIVALTNEQYARLEERVKGWQWNNAVVPAPRKRERLKKSQEAATL